MEGKQHKRTICGPEGLLCVEHKHEPTKRSKLCSRILEKDGGEGAEEDSCLLNKFLPDELLHYILCMVPSSNAGMAARTCKRWYSCCPVSLRNKLDPFATHCSKSMLQWSLDNGYSNHYFVCTKVAARGGLEALQWAREQDFRWDTSVCAHAAARGDLEMLKWARSEDCPWNPWTVLYAARNGQLEVLQWIKENGCPWNFDSVCCQAALYGRLETLQWARENGCPWDARVCTNAASNGHLEVLKWARQQACPWDKSLALDKAKNNQHQEVYQWILDNYQ
ncbi:Ankyrin repeat-containing domain [Balamuthia mandrillaris]